MKSKLIAIFLSLFFVCLSGQATQQIEPPVKKIDQSSARIDLNKADAHALTNSIKGIGPKRAESIIKYRNEHGQFKSIDELANVKGIGTNFVKKHQKQLQETFMTQ